MTKNKLKYIIMCWIMLGVLGICTPNSVVYSAPASQTNLSQKLKKTNEQKNYIHEKKRQTDIKLRKEKNRLSNNQQKLERTRQELINSQNKYNSLILNLSSLERQLDVAVKDFQKTDAEMKERIRQVYKQQRVGMFELFMSTKDLNSLMDMFYYEKIIIKLDYQRLKTLKEKADNINKLKGEIERQKAQISASIKTMNNQKAIIQNSIEMNKSMIERLNKDKNYYEKTERELARQSASIQSMIAGMAKQQAKTGNYSVKVSGGFIRPISGPITSPFGYRIHPIFKSRIFHSGIDIGGPNGGAIKASNDGKVIYTGWYGGYGKVVILDHGLVNGKPVTTLYAHMSSISVSNGQMVTKGQTVGREGSTGYSTGPHCHFEVRENGKPVNPFNYI